MTVAGICNSVGGGVFCHATEVAVPVANIGLSRLRLLTGNRDVAAISDPAVLECANCSRHATVATVSLSTVPRLSLLSRQVGSGEADVRGKAGGVADWTDSPCFHAIK